MRPFTPLTRKVFSVPTPKNKPTPSLKLKPLPESELNHVVGGIVGLPPPSAR